MKFLLTKTIIKESSAQGRIHNTLSMEMELGRVDGHNVAQRVARYLQENHISVEQVERDLGIEHGRFSDWESMRLEAGEFLELCHYLNVPPESFMSDTEE